MIDRWFWGRVERAVEDALRRHGREEGREIVVDELDIRRIADDVAADLGRALGRG